MVAPVRMFLSLVLLVPPPRACFEKVDWRTRKGFPSTLMVRPGFIWATDIIVVGIR